MPYRRFLSTYYGIQAEEKIHLFGREGYRKGNELYFIMILENKETFYTEKMSLSAYLMENGYSHIAFPKVNLQGDWHTPLEGNKYIVLAVQPSYQEPLQTGIALARFHQIGSNYPYQPKEVSSYGHWRSLWIDKLTAYEMKIQQEAEKRDDEYHQLWMDVLPYIIGLSENAIQYVRQSEQEQRFSEVDQGTVAFHRYHNQLENPILWLDDFVYDHPARDIAEYLRGLLFTMEKREEAFRFLEEYQSVRPLSVFSWRLIYGRLLFPIPFYDLLYRGFQAEKTDDGTLHGELQHLLKKQTRYENVLKNFFELAGIDAEMLQIPMVQWL